MFSKETTLSDRVTSDFPDRDVEDQDGRFVNWLSCRIMRRKKKKNYNRSVQTVYLYISHDEFRFFFKWRNWWPLYAIGSFGACCAWVSRHFTRFYISYRVSRNCKKKKRKKNKRKKKEEAIDKKSIPNDLFQFPSFLEKGQKGQTRLRK